MAHHTRRVFRTFCIGQRCVVMILLTLIIPASSSAQQATPQPDEAETMPVVELTLHPRPVPDPPLKYSLLPPYLDMKARNAAIWYYRALLLLPREKTVAFGEEQQQWLSLPLDQFPKDQAHQFLVSYRNSLHETKTATYCDHCNWELNLRDLKGMETLGFLLPEMQEVRTVARVLRVKTRLEIAEQRYDDAIQTLTMHYRLAQNVARSPVLISNLVAVAIAKMANDSVQDWIESGGPNLYWALAGLPSPLIDMREALRQEENLPLQTFPFLKDPEHENYTPSQWRQIIGESVQQLSGIAGNVRHAPSNLLAQSAATGLIMAGYGRAKQELIKSGMDPQKVDAMPVGQVVAIQAARAYRKVYQETMKWTLLPFWQGYRQMHATFESLRRDGYFNTSLRFSGVLPIAAIFLPAIESAVLAPVRTQRELDALRTIEAIRCQAAATGGKLPASLSDLQQVPAPLDPVTGTAYIYRTEGVTAVLELPPPEGRSPSQFGKQYKLRVSDAKPQ